MNAARGKATVRTPKAMSAVDVDALHTAQQEADKLLREWQAVVGQGWRGPSLTYRPWRDDDNDDGTDDNDDATHRAATHTRWSSCIDFRFVLVF